PECAALWPAVGLGPAASPLPAAAQESMSRITCKFGGSSLADASQMRKVRAIVDADPRRSVIVVSAPGKRSKSDVKLTDLLYLCHKSASIGTHFDEPFAGVRQRFLDIERELGVAAGMSEQLDRLAVELT